VKQKRRVYVLVKAYPQPSQTYEETVCCAGVSENGEFVRLYPIRYRRLPADARFDRFDLIEVEGERPRDDHRPESFHVDEGSIRILSHGSKLKPEGKVKIWLPLVAPSLSALRASNDKNRASLGIVRPDTNSVRFTWIDASKSAKQDQAIGHALFQQSSLLESPLKPLTAPEYAFYYAYTSGGTKSKGQIHDWEVQAAYYNYKKLYGADALAHMDEMYGQTMPAQNLHLILGTMKAHPKQFIIIGLLRSTVDIQGWSAQGHLFS
jgi:hypothetical protein